MSGKLSDMKTLGGDAKSLSGCGVLLAWLAVRAGKATFDHTALTALFPGLGAGNWAVHQSSKRMIFPIRIGDLDKLVGVLSATSYEKVLDDEFIQKHAEDSWVFLSVLSCNSLYGSRDVPLGRWRRHEKICVASMRKHVQRCLRLDCRVAISAEEVEKELSSRYISYSGEEVPKMEPLTFEQVLPALPPETHGGAIPSTDWTRGKAREFLLRPESCVVADHGQKLPPLQAKVHIRKGEERKVAELLVERNICDWIESSSVLEFRGTKVLNGMFGVPKSSVLEDGRPQLRVIMNLIPSNSVTVQLSGSVVDLPGVTQYMSLIIDEGQEIRFCQSDMTSAFYLFSLPDQWRRFLSFNIHAKGEDIGKLSGRSYTLACKVLPMGWSSAVSIMQEMSSILLEKGGLGEEVRLQRTKPVPDWFSRVLSAVPDAGSGWYHVYLDNFFSGEKKALGSKGGEGEELHNKAEKIWAETGVISSAKKKVSNAEVVQELGALLDGPGKMIGASSERLLKLAKTTMVLISLGKIPRKWLQVVCGRWVHVLQFRRAGMVGLHWVWQWISGKQLSPKGKLQVRRELLTLCMGLCLFHTNLGASVSETASASDASSKGGAVGQAKSLSSEGADFVYSTSGRRGKLGKAPVLSLFNGIGGALRTYDVLGLEVAAMIAVDLSKPANRVTSRRWPQAIIVHDVREITRDMIFQWLLQYPHVEEIHLWGGFPCVDLSSVKHNRLNLLGRESGLFFEIIRIRDLLREVWGNGFPLVFFVENVASMDRSACREISGSLGVKPYKVQCADAVPISRPRFCWTNKPLEALEGVVVTEREDWFEVVAVGPYPAVSQWLREDSTWEYEDSGEVFPTCMKAIKRSVPPPKPAGLDRTPAPARERWEADSFKYPPYQYKDPYVIWSPKGWRLLEASERELLHGYGYGHTSLCFSASEIKKSFEAYEDMRCSLIGDSFSVYSFVIFAWNACKKYMKPTSYVHLCQRMGMSPGFCAPIDLRCPLTRSLSYGSGNLCEASVGDLTRLLLTRVNHTGSDVRVSTGTIMNSKAFPRQSAAADWWQWEPVFNTCWARKEHINRLEMKSTLLTLRWRIQNLGEFDCRFVHLTDSYVCMSVISKGRSSSEMLMSVLREIGALQLAFGLFPIFIHVESTENPTDDASRV